MASKSLDRFDVASDKSERGGAHRAEKPRMNGWVALLWAFVSTLILAVGGSFAFLVFSERITLFPEPPAVITPEPSHPGTVDTSYVVLILNGTPDTGLDARFRDLVVNEGWNGADVFAGPSGTTQFNYTTIYYQRESDLEAARGLATAIGGALLELDDYYASAEDPDSKQLTIVIGLDRSTVLPDEE